jgi:predicted nucleotide-binding protein
MLAFHPATMASKSTPEPPSGPTLTTEQAKAQLEDALRRGRRLLEENPLSKERYDVWDRNTLRIITSAFGEGSGHDMDFIGQQNFTVAPVQEVYAERQRRQDLQRQLRVLEALIDGLPTVVPKLEETRSENTQAIANRKVFIVHGHDGELKHATARLVTSLGLKPIILHEQDNRNQTIIEKFTVQADVGFAVVLLSADDEGRSRTASSEALKHRARQNVIFEMGYFFCRLGRERVCVVYESDVELPSDLHGILYVPYDTEKGWMYAVAREMKAAGYEVDLNKV